MYRFPEELPSTRQSAKVSTVNSVHQTAQLTPLQRYVRDRHKDKDPHDSELRKILGLVDPTSSLYLWKGRKAPIKSDASAVTSSPTVSATPTREGVTEPAIRDDWKRCRNVTVPKESGAVVPKAVRFSVGPADLVSRSFSIFGVLQSEAVNT